MKKIIKDGLRYISFILVVALIFSCGVTSSYLVGDGIESGDRNFRESFIKVENKLTARDCKAGDKTCTVERVISSASAFVVSTGKTGAYAITAAHFCEDDVDLLLQSLIRGTPIQKVEFFAYDIDMRRYDVNVINYDRKLDLCLIYVKKLQRKQVLLAHRGPEPGDKAYNLAAPLGMFGANTIPKLDGYYTGNLTRDPRDAKQIFSIYTIPAIGGSSGSPIFDANGLLIGMIHSVNIRFPFLTYSPTFKQLKDYIADNVPY